MENLAVTLGLLQGALASTARVSAFRKDRLGEKMRDIITALAFLCFGLSANAEPVTGNDLLAACESAGDAQQGFCIGYVLGAVEGMYWGIAWPLFLMGKENVDKVNETSATILMICEPEGVIAAQYIDITKA